MQMMNPDYLKELQEQRAALRQDARFERLISVLLRVGMLVLWGLGTWGQPCCLPWW